MKNFKQKIHNLLKWSEQYTATDMVYLAKGGFWLTLGQIVSAGSAFLLAIAFANLLPKETYGTYKYILSIAGILSISTLAGMNTAIIQAVARGYEGSFIPILKIKIYWGLMGGLASLILAGYYYFNGNTTLTISFLISAVFLPFMDSFGIYNTLLLGRKLFNVSVKYSIISQIIAVAALIAALFFTKNIFLILLAYFTSWTILRFIFLKITLKKFPPNNQQDSQTISYGKHLSFMNILPLIAQQLDKILLWHFLGPVQLAIYSFAIAIPNQIKSLFKNLQTLILPKFSERSREEIKTALFNKILKLGMLLIFITILYILFAPFIYKILFPEYLESILYSQIFAISIIATTLAILPTTFLQAKLAQKELYQFYTIGAIFQIAALFILIYQLGLIGAVIAKIISEFFNLICLFFLIKRK